ncbi:hypothetical protein TNCV_3565351 [Trichonephila clavipes]|nr:hypothetical protein TNCV_3565351 [Trichonephila clavipes]
MVEAWRQNNNNIVRLFNWLSNDVKVFFQWVLSHIYVAHPRGKIPNESIDGGCLTFKEIAIRQDISSSWRQAPVHEGNRGGAAMIGASS